MKPTVPHMEEIEDLPKAITEILARLGHQNPNAWQVALHPDAYRPDIITDVKRFLINRCFRLILGEVTTENTMDTRFCLVDQGPISEWLKLFEEGIAPTVVRLNLPFVIGKEHVI
ncbi:MAG: hypothetical protein ACD_84C00039G0002 [uncultured bacterium]|nr:MAG: hypothetical protein ACD_84C00039G0002 [uncultured bacterium]